LNQRSEKYFIISFFLQRNLKRIIKNFLECQTHLFHCDIFPDTAKKMLSISRLAADFFSARVAR